MTIELLLLCLIVHTLFAMLSLLYCPHTRLEQNKILLSMILSNFRDNTTHPQNIVIQPGKYYHRPWEVSLERSEKVSRLSEEQKWGWDFSHLSFESWDILIDIPQIFSFSQVTLMDRRKLSWKYYSLWFYDANKLHINIFQLRQKPLESAQKKDTLYKRFQSNQTIQ